MVKRKDFSLSEKVLSFRPLSGRFLDKEGATHDQLKFLIAHREDYLYAKKALDSPAIKAKKKLDVAKISERIEIYDRFSQSFAFECPLPKHLKRKVLEDVE